MSTTMCSNIVLESIIKKDAALNKMYSTNNKLFNFIPGDKVTCSYMSGFFYVNGFDGNRLILKNVEQSSISIVGPEFVKKANFNENLVKLLYKK